MTDWQKLLIDTIHQAVLDDPRRSCHYNTAEVGFFVVGDKYYPWKQWSTIPVKDRFEAVPVHSHSGTDPEDYLHRSGKALEDFQPLNAMDIYQWVQGFKKGTQGYRQAILMWDGRMEILELTRRTKPALFKLSCKQFEEALHGNYAERSEYYEKHKNAPDWETYKDERERLQDFCDRWGLNYYRGLHWKPATEKIPFKKEEPKRIRRVTRIRTARRSSGSSPTGLGGLR